MKDGLRRSIEYLRISVTDRCNLRCRYCMPEHGVEKLHHADILSYEEILRVVEVLATLGIKKVRITGGEPLIRAGVAELVWRIKNVRGIEQVMLTTNGVLLPNFAAELAAAGLDGVNVSLDTLRDDTFLFLARRPNFSRVQAGIEALKKSGLKNIKLNCVPLAGVNDDDIVPLAGMARDYPMKVRFIELMPIGTAFASGLRGIAMAKVRRRIETVYGELRPIPNADRLSGPARYFAPPNFAGAVGFIDALEHKFCAECNRIRLTAEGFLKLCLNARTGIDVRKILRAGGSDEELAAAIERAISEKPREHFFQQKNAASQVRDTRQMYQVGG